MAAQSTSVNLSFAWRGKTSFSKDGLTQAVESVRLVFEKTSLVVQITPNSNPGVVRPLRFYSLGSHKETPNVDIRVNKLKTLVLTAGCISYKENEYMGTMINGHPVTVERNVARSEKPVLVDGLEQSFAAKNYQLVVEANDQLQLTAHLEELSQNKAMDFAIFKATVFELLSPTLVPVMLQVASSFGSTAKLSSERIEKLAQEAIYKQLTMLMSQENFSDLRAKIHPILKNMMDRQTNEVQRQALFFKMLPIFFEYLKPEGLKNIMTIFLTALIEGDPKVKTIARVSEMFYDACLEMSKAVNQEDNDVDPKSMNDLIDILHSILEPMMQKQVLFFSLRSVSLNYKLKKEEEVPSFKSQLKLHIQVQLKKMNSQQVNQLQSKTKALIDKNEGRQQAITDLMKDFICFLGMDGLMTLLEIPVLTLLEAPISQEVRSSIAHVANAFKDELFVFYGITLPAKEKKASASEYKD